MRTYLDASVLVSLFVTDAFSARAEGIVRGAAGRLIVSDFASAEFSSALARRVRSEELTVEEARAAFAEADAWAPDMIDRLETTSADIRLAERFVRRLDMSLRAPDALNIALAMHARATLATFDIRMAVAAHTLRLPVTSA